MRRQIIWAAMTAATVSVLSMTFPLGTRARDDEIDEWRSYVEDVCGNYSICPEFVEALIEAESGWDADAVNGTCIGLMQVDARWHAERMAKLDASDLYDPYDNILVGVDYLWELFDKYEDAAYVLMAYNGDSDVGTYAETGVMSEYAAGILERSAELERMNGK